MSAFPVFGNYAVVSARAVCCGPPVFPRFAFACSCSFAFAALRSQYRAWLAFTLSLFFWFHSLWYARRASLAASLISAIVFYLLSGLFCSPLFHASIAHFPPGLSSAGCPPSMYCRVCVPHSVHSTQTRKRARPVPGFHLTAALAPHTEHFLIVAIHCPSLSGLTFCTKCGLLSVPDLARPAVISAAFSVRLYKLPLRIVSKVLFCPFCMVFSGVSWAGIHPGKVALSLHFLAPQCAAVQYLWRSFPACLVLLHLPALPALCMYVCVSVYVYRSMCISGGAVRRSFLCQPEKPEIALCVNIGARCG